MTDPVPHGRWMPLVSVVVPTRDRPDVLKRAVTAILDQDYRGAIECLVVFDQSPPRLPVDLPLRAGRTLRALSNTRTPGLAGARNTGILEGRGELIAFCDDDDEWLPSKLSEQVRELEAAPEHCVVTTGIITVTGDRLRERVLRQRTISHETFLRSRVMEAHPSTLLIRRDALLNRVGLVDEQIPGSYGEDYEWLLRASTDAPLLVTRKALVRIDLHPKSYFAEQWSTIAAACRYLLERHPDLRLVPSGLARIYGRIALAEAALGHRGAARRYAARSLRLRLRQHRAYFALAISAGLFSAERAVRFANVLGRGI